MTRHHRSDQITDALILIPRAARRSESRRERILRACRWCWSRGIFPSPAALSLRLRGRSTRTLNGFETRVRNEWLDEKKIPHPRAYAYYRRLIAERAADAVAPGEEK